MKQRSVFLFLAAVVVAAIAGSFFIASAIAERDSYNPFQQGPEPATSVENAPNASFQDTYTVVRLDRFESKPNDWIEFSSAEMPDENGVWSARAGKLAQEGTEAASTGFDDAIALAPVDTTGTAIVSAQVYPQGNQVVGLAFRASDAGYYLFRVFRGGGDLPLRYQLQRYDASNAMYTTLVEDSTGAGYELGRWQELRVGLSGDEITCFFDGKQVLSAKDDTYSDGDAGVYALTLGDVLFDNFAVARLQGQ